MKEQQATYIYMIRHGESPKDEGNEHTRGLTNKGKADAKRITELLKHEGINTFISSPYKRALLTIQELADYHDKDILIDDNLKECVFMGKNEIIQDSELKPLVKQMFSAIDFSLSGESLVECQKRSVKALKNILKLYQRQKIVIGTHGLVMTLMIGFFDQ